ncbi:DEAD/DEAH box helicase [Phanerochaete sordida]|uniref:DEAD/DEAH box helicase n=1 Tax=Phanerochaete sordida TaxID=48140 RepID=A0A9P3LJ82_9APHY|nr:DEAD/DEAH box helicase [Phanerochaete sordida]
MSPKCCLQSLYTDHAPDLDGPYALYHFLSAGALRLQLKTRVEGCSQGTHPSPWHHYLGHGHLASLVRAEDEQFTRLLDFLIDHKFIAVTCRVRSSAFDSVLFIRVYFIPHDLANVEGKLRRRDEATVVAPARRYLRTLLLRISRDASLWGGEAADDASCTTFFDEAIDNRTLAELYNTLPSPIISEDEQSIHPHALEVLDGAEIPGLKSTLYTYQRRSVAAMMQRELQPGVIPDPLYVPLHGIDGSVFYFQPATMEVLRECPTVAQTRGGILCEELGTGKTVMSLSLILATLDQLPEPEESFLDPRPVLTPLAARHFPSQVYADAREKCTSRTRRHASEAGLPQTIPSLTEHILHLCARDPASTGVRACEETLRPLGLWRAYRDNTPFYHHFADEPPVSLRSCRKPRTENAPRTVYLSSATLVVVPPNLFNQWSNEINKHCDTTLRTYVVKDNKSLPCARRLAFFDVILMTHPRLSHEGARMGKDKLQKLHSMKPCECTPREHSAARVPYCRCKPPEDVSPLLQVRFKRLIVDEGNNLSDTTTVLMGCIEQLSVECKWIVTGTPTTNLMGLHFGSGSELTYPQEDGDETEDEALAAADYRQRVITGARDATSDCDSTDSAPPSPTSCGFLQSSGSSPTAKPAHSYARVWTKNDRGDLNKLGALISSFLRIPRFAADAKLYASSVVAPLMDAGGPRPGALQVLTQVMQSTMIRHRIQDIEREVLLPTLHQETVLLDLDPVAVRTYNVLQASIAVNLVTSEREGADWIFHPRNTAALQQTIENISQAMFWHMDEDTFKIDELISMGPTFLNTAKVRGVVSEDDIRLLEESLHHLDLAGSDPVWRALMQHPYVFTRVYNMPTPIYDKWSILPAEIGSLTGVHDLTPFMFMTPDRLRPLRNYVQSNPLAPVGRLQRLGEHLGELEQRRVQYNAERARVNKGMRKLRDSDRRQKATTPAAGNEPALRLIEAQKRFQDEFHTVWDEQTGSALLGESPLAGVRVGNSASSKLNYILNEVRLHADSSKLLIFSKSPLTLLYVAEGLNLMGVKYKLTSQKRIKQVEQDVMTFESSDTYRVFLMELKHGARGLNIITASRVIFCEPVWQADVETQAIKRVHRIGQTKAVFVKTLAIRDTAEEVMVTRRDALKRGLGAAGGKLPNLAEDNVMRELIAHPKFLPDPPAPSLVLDYPLLPEVPVQDDAPSVSTIERPHTPEPVGPVADDPMQSGSEASPQKLVIKITPKRVREDDNETSEPAPKRKARVVRFADEV